MLEGADSIDVGHDVQLFFDLEGVQMLQDVTQRVHRPRRHPANPLVRGDQAWEKLLYFVFSSGNVLFSPRENLFRLWYEDLGFDHPAFMADPDPFPWDHMAMHYLYAESDDGIRWRKPALDVEPGTNIIFGTPDYKVHVMSILDDPRAKDANERFKGLYVTPTVARGTGHRVALATSPDGVHWTPSPERPHFGGASQQLGDVLILSFDASLARYVLLCRHPSMHGAPPPASLPRTRSFLRPRLPNDPIFESRRRIYRSESDDLLEWSEPELVFMPDDEDNWDDTFFGMVQFRRGPMHIGFLDVFHTVENSWNVQLAYSRDGRSWNRVERGQPYLGYGADGAWDRWCVNVTSQPIVRGDEMWLYYGGAINHHDYWFARDHADIDLAEAGNINLVDHGMGLASVRLDGFVSASATLRQGIIVTHPLHAADSERLEVNVTCGAGGSFCVELTDAEDQVLTGFARDDCDLFSGDATAHTVTWRGSPNLPAATRTAVKLRFYLKQADLYSYRFAAAATPR